MNKPSSEEKQRITRLNKTFLYDLGYHQVDNIGEMTDKLLDEHKDLHIPDTMNQWFIEFNKEQKKQAKYRILKKRALQVSRKVAALLIVASIVASVVTMSVEAFRVKFFNLVIETSQKFSLVTQEEVGNPSISYQLPEEWQDYYYPTYLPDEYILSVARILNDTKHMLFSSPDGKEIRFIQGNNSSESQIDSEGGNIIDVEINGQNGVLVVKNELAIISWSDGDTSFSIQGNVDKSTILAIAESIKKNK